MWLDSLDFFVRNLYIYLPWGLLVIAVFQMIYLIYLSLTSQTEGADVQPTSPIMPASEDGSWSQKRLSDGLPDILTQVGGNIAGGMTTDHGLMGRFVIEAGTKEVLERKEYSFPDDEFIIGRYANANLNIPMLPIDEPSISRRHLFFEGDEDLQEYYITDEESTYGTYLLKEEQFVQLAANIPERVYNQDVIQIGSKVRLRLILPTETRQQAIR